MKDFPVQSFITVLFFDPCPSVRNMKTQASARPCMVNAQVFAFNYSLMGSSELNTHARRHKRRALQSLMYSCHGNRKYLGKRVCSRLLASLTWTAHMSGWWSLNPIAVNLLWKLYFSDKEQRDRGEEETGAEGWEQRGVVDWQKQQWKVLIVVSWHNVRNHTCYTRRTQIGVEINVLFILKWKRKVCG